MDKYLEKLAAELDKIAEEMEKSETETITEKVMEGPNKTDAAKEKKAEDDADEEKEKEETKEEGEDKEESDEDEDKKETKKEASERVLDAWGSVEETVKVSNSNKGTGKYAGYRDPIEAFAMS